MIGPRKMRVVYVNHTGHVSGAERVLLDILRGIDRDQIEPHVICPAEGRLPNEIKAEGIPCLPLPPVNVRFASRPDRLILAVAPFMRAIMTLRRHILAIRPDLVHANTIRSGIAATAATVGTKIPVLWHVHDILPKHAFSAVIRAFAWASRRSQIVAVSHATAIEFCGDFDFGSRVRTIHNGTDLSKFPAKSEQSAAFRRELGIPAEAFLVCAVGQICARKGLLELVEVIKQIHKDVPQLHLAMVGRAVFKHEEDYLRTLQEAVAASGCSEKIHFIGELRDVAPVLRAADLLVLNSRQEPFGLVLIEAMSSGTPVLATRVGGIPEIVSNSENGWLVEAGDTAGLAAQLSHLARNRGLLKQAAEIGRTITCPQFSLHRFQRNLSRLYSEFELKQSLEWSVRNQPALSESGKN
jgi:glycosyltransferase involved in cell wall biosynthesis